MTAPVARGLGAAQFAFGCLLVARPSQVAGQVPSWLVRLLGARGVVQGALIVAVPDPAVLALGASADAAHALSMVPVALGSKRYRRPAGISASIATVMAVAGAALARSDVKSARQA